MIIQWEKLQTYWFIDFQNFTIAYHEWALTLLYKSQNYRIHMSNHSKSYNKIIHPNVIIEIKKKFFIISVLGGVRAVRVAALERCADDAGAGWSDQEADRKVLEGHAVRNLSWRYVIHAKNPPNFDGQK